MYSNGEKQNIGQRFMYVKQELLENIRQNQTKVLINPNFVNKSLVKPHFNKQFLLNQAIHINPNVIKQTIGDRPTSELVKKEREVIIESEERNEIPKQNLILSTRTKIIRSPKIQNESSRIRRISIHTKYKIIRSSLPQKNILVNNTIKGKSRFCVDYRSHNIKRKYFCFNKDNKLKAKNVYRKNNLNLNKNCVSINGIIYRKSTLLKHRSTKCIRKPKVGSSLKLKILTIRGQKYEMDSAHRTLTLVPNQIEKPKSTFKTIYVGGMTFKEKEPNVYVKTNAHRRLMLLSQAKQRSINTLTNKLKKSNIPCPLYHKFGKCRGKESGKCIRLHNPEQISLCPKFLQGACTDMKCLLSHKISAEKMPTCKFFLEGLCSKENCSYLHVKINSKAEICKDFLEGFCRKAAECEKRHQYLCPTYERTGQCLKKNCQYPHGVVVRKSKISKVNITNLQDKLKPKIGIKKRSATSSVSTLEFVEKKENLQEKDNVRYYEELNTSENEADARRDDQSISSLVTERPKLGSLPSFIPFFDKGQSDTVVPS